MPFFTIAIVTRNYGHFIEAAIRSCLAGADQDVEVLVVDDGSEDDTAQVVQAVCAHHPKGAQVRYHRAGPIGLAAARNESLRLAQGEYLVCLDADDVLMPETLMRYRRVLQDHPDVDVLYGHVVATYPDLVPLARLSTEVIRPYPYSLAVLLGRNPIPHAGSASRIRLMREIGGYRKGLDRAEDYAMWLDLAAHHARFHYVDACVALYRRHDDNATQNLKPEWDLPVIQAMLERYELRELLPDLGWQRDEASAHLSAVCVMARRLLQARADEVFVRDFLANLLCPSRSCGQSSVRDSA